MAAQLAAVVWVQSLAWKFLHAAGAAKKKKKKPKRIMKLKKKKEADPKRPQTV